MTPSADRPSEVRRATPTAAELWGRARGSVDLGRPGTGYRLGSRALTHLAREHLPAEAAATLRARILITMADAQVELGAVEQAGSLLDAALRASPDVGAIVQASRGVLLARTGRLDASRESLDAAVAGLSDSGGSRHNLVRALLWRGMLHLGEARLDLAAADCATAAELGRQAGLDAAVVIAEHNLGLVRFTSGDLPGALQSMSRADEIGPRVRVGVRALDRSRVLLAAGLLAEAREVAERAERAFAAERSRVELADALLVTAEIDLLAGVPGAARTAARRAARTYATARHQRGVFAARVMEARAEGQVRAALRPPSRHRSARDADLADVLARALAESGLPEDARAVRLLQAQALLELGQVADARRVAAAAAELGAARGVDRAPGPRAGRGGRWDGRSTRVPLIATELHTRVVQARIELAGGNRSGGLLQIRRGLDDLAAYQARFGSQDLQSASAVHGFELTRLGLRTALQTESPAAILQWLERSRAASTRLAAVRPSADGVLARELSRLRVATARARMAEMAGSPDPDLEDEVDQLRRRVRSRSWLVGGSGSVNRPLSLAAVQRRLAEAGGHVSIVAPFRGGGRFHALVITARTARYLRLSRDFGLETALNRIIGDLNILADHRVLAPLRRVAASSLQTGLNRVADYIARPVEPLVADGPVVVAAAGSAAIVPWALLPGLSGRAISVSPSVTAAVAGMGRTAEEFRHGVLSVAGPEVPHGVEEAQTVAAVYDDGSPFGASNRLLTGSEATGRAVLDAIPAGGLLHIAAHGHHEPENPLFSGVLLADGLLYGYDVAPNPNLPSQVVLSSCDVGRTDDRPGGEPLGLVAALLRSGVGTVVAGTSRISDRMAAAVMTAYHQRLFKGEAPAIALAGAIKAAAEVEDDPAPFTCFGAGL